METAEYPQHQITGVVLAGGRGRRMGGTDKGLEILSGKPMAAHVIEALTPQCNSVLINANRNHADYRALGCDVFADLTGEFDGPLAGIASGLRTVGTRLVLFAPCDSPLLARSLGLHLWNALHTDASEIAVAHDGDRLHPVFALMHASLADSAFAYLASGERKIDRWYAQHTTSEVRLPQLSDTFLNVNRPADKIALEQRFSKLQQSDREKIEHEPRDH